MLEKEIRKTIRDYCSELDMKARTAGLVAVPLMLGVGLAATACDDESEAGPTTSSSGTTSTSGTGGAAGSTSGVAGGGGEGGMGAIGGAGGGVAGAGGTGGIGGGIGGAVLYMAPDA